MKPDVDHSVDPLLNVTLLRDKRTVPLEVTQISRPSRGPHALLTPISPLLHARYGAPVPPAIDERSVRANGVEFQLLCCGDGPLALCFHGFPDSAHTWRHLLVDLAETATEPSLRSSVATRRPRYRGRALSIRCAEHGCIIHEALGGGSDAVLIGHDWGRRRCTARRAMRRTGGEPWCPWPCRRRARRRLPDEPSAGQALLVHVHVPAPAGRPAGRRQRPRVRRHAVVRLVAWFDAAAEPRSSSPRCATPPTSRPRSATTAPGSVTASRTPPSTPSKPRRSRSSPAVAVPPRRRRRLHRRGGRASSPKHGARQRDRRHRRRDRPLPAPGAARRGQPTDPGVPRLMTVSGRPASRRVGRHRQA